MRIDTGACFSLNAILFLGAECLVDVATAPSSLFNLLLLLLKCPPHEMGYRYLIYSIDSSFLPKEEQPSIKWGLTGRRLSPSLNHTQPEHSLCPKQVEKCWHPALPRKIAFWMGSWGIGITPCVLALPVQVEFMSC